MGVIWQEMTVLVGRWEHLLWLHKHAGTRLVGTHFKDYWVKSLLMLHVSNTRLQVQFASAIKTKLIDFVYRWIRAEGRFPSGTALS